MTGLPGEYVGVLLVHGTGRQEPYEHLNSEARNLLAALSDRVEAVSVRLPLRAGEAWHPEKTLVVDARAGSTITRYEFREVYWADLVDPPTAGRQLGTWFRALSMWAIAGVTSSRLRGFARMHIPPGPANRRALWHVSVVDRVLLGLCGVALALAVMSFGAVNFVLARLKLGKLPLSNLLAAYLADVMQYTAAEREAAGTPGDFRQPLRVDIRARMVRSTVAMAAAGYDRWYILAHGQGTVVAFNALTELEDVLPSYLTETEWNTLSRRCPGLIDRGPPGADVTMPRRPIWLTPADRIPRSTLFARLRGFMTYGSPLSKYHAIWPAIVPCNDHARVFRSDFEWINIWEPTDPIGGRLEPFRQIPSLDVSGRVRRAGSDVVWTPPYDGSGVLRVRTYAYAANPMWLLSHLRYLSYRRASRPQTASADKDPQLAARVAQWLGTGRGFDPAGTELSPARQALRSGLRMLSVLGLAGLSWVLTTILVDSVWMPLVDLVAGTGDCEPENRVCPLLDNAGTWLASVHYVQWSVGLWCCLIVALHLYIPIRSTFDGRPVRAWLDWFVAFVALGWITVNLAAPRWLWTMLGLERQDPGAWLSSGSIAATAVAVLLTAINAVVLLGIVRKTVQWLAGTAETGGRIDQAAWPGGETVKAATPYVGAAE